MYFGRVETLNLEYVFLQGKDWKTRELLKYELNWSEACSNKCAEEVLQWNWCMYGINPDKYQNDIYSTKLYY